MAMAQASWPGRVDLTHTFQPPFAFTMDCASTQFTDGDNSQGTSPLETHGGDWCEGRDAFPITEKPVPTTVHPHMETLWGADPSLCVTPEKPLTGSRLLISAKSVRFNPLVEVRRRSDENSPGGHTDVHKGADASGSSLSGHYITGKTSPEAATMPLDESLGPISILASNFECGIEHSGSVLSKSANTESVEEALPPGSSLRAKDTSSADTGSRSDPLWSHNIRGSRSDIGSCDIMSPMQFEESDAFLAKPGLNSSRWLAMELRQLQVNDLDIDLALRERLAASSRLRGDIMEKSSQRVNAEGRRQFVNLLSVDVSEEDLVRTVEQTTAARVRPGHLTRHTKTEELAGSEPDILDLLGGVGQQEGASVSLAALPPLLGRLRTVHVSSAFDVIKHIRAWEAW